MGGDLNVGSPSQANAIWQWVNRGAHILKLITPKSPTFRTGSKLDYFISSTDAFINKFCSVNDLGLQHNLIHSTINFSHRALSTPQELIYKWSKADWEAFRTAASLCQTTKIPSDCLLPNSEIDALIEQFSNDLRLAMSEAIPKGLRGRHTQEDLPSEADFLFKERRRLRQTLKRARGKWAADADRIEHLRREINKATALINKHIRKINSDRIDSMITNINNNVNRFRELRALSGNFAPRSCLRVKDGQGNEITSPTGKLQELRVFYEGLYSYREPNCRIKPVIDELHNQLVAVPSIVTFSQNNPANRPTICTHKFTNLKVVSAFIKQIPNKTSFGPDLIPNTVLKQLPYSYLQKLTSIFNHCINNSYFPSKWKLARIIPILKKSGVLAAKEFRPISMTSNVGKILEDSISYIIKSEMKAEAVPWTQFGFRVGHSTVDALTVFRGR